MKKAANKPTIEKSFNGYWILLAIWVLSMSILISLNGYFEGFGIFQKAPRNSKNGPKFWTLKTNPTSLEEVITVLDRLGFAELKGDEAGDNWDFLWSDQLPFKIIKNLTNLKPHQKVNHFPGIKCLVEKFVMTTITESEYIPKAFGDAKSFQNYVSENPGKKFLQKQIKNKGVSLKEADQIDVNDKNFFAQTFVENPLLIDGHFFDFGVYVVITSIDPLRIYVYKDDIMLRFCPEKYHPFNASKLDQYIISDSRIFSWDITSINKFYKQKYSTKSSFNAHLESQGIDIDDIWRQVEECIIEVVQQNEIFLLDESEKYKSKDNFFEMIRFDFILDEEVDVHLLKIKMSPNLHAEGKSAPLNRFYEQITYNLLNLVGIGSHLGGRSSLEIRNYAEELMLSSSQNVAVNASLCDTCDDQQSCKRSECEICSKCMSWQNLHELQMTYREHMNQGNFKRLFPVVSDDEEYLQELSTNNRKLTKWINAKCNEDDFWC